MFVLQRQERIFTTFHRFYVFNLTAKINKLYM